MNRQHRRRSNPPDHPDGQSDQAVTKRFKTLYGKPKTLTDRYDECSAEAIAHLLSKAEAELTWNDFNMLYRVGVAPATYQEGLYFLPAAIAFLRRSPNPDAVDCVADVMWFLSEYAARLEQDGLLPECREQILALLRERTVQFVVVHWDREKNRQMGRDRDHYDYVEDSQLVCHTVEALLRFKSLGEWSAGFIGELGSAQNAPVKSAWFLECVKDSRNWALFRGTSDSPATTRFTESMLAAMPQLRGLWEEFQKRGMVQDRPGCLEPDRCLIERHARVIRNAGRLFTDHPTYWGDLFRNLGLADDVAPPNLA